MLWKPVWEGEKGKISEYGHAAGGAVRVTEDANLSLAVRAERVTLATVAEHELARVNARPIGHTRVKGLRSVDVLAHVSIMGHAGGEVNTYNVKSPQKNFLSL
jgi:fructose-1,6-bisphosphatase/inositol monophosphatase family enzyme